VIIVHLINAKIVLPNMEKIKTNLIRYAVQTVSNRIRIKYIKLITNFNISKNNNQSYYRIFMIYIKVTGKILFNKHLSKNNTI
jgi:hypothetical protein